MCTRYVVAVNDTRSSGNALAWARARARRTHIPLITVRVEPDSDTTTAGSSEEIVLRGPISHTLAGFAQSDDLLVIGTGKTGFIHARGYGARGIQIASTVRSSVAVIPDVDLRFRTGVVAGIDHAATAVLVASVADADAAALGEPLQLIHSSFGRSTPANAADTRSELAAATAAVKERWPTVVVRSRSTSRPAPEALLDASRNATLLVLGPGCSQPDSPFALVIHDVLVNINAPVLIARTAVNEPASSFGHLSISGEG
ncbi:hypothetical protein FHX48_002297 [Microbacterium halimionae]|uniref:Universal stress protein n=1 Tax=Microbacterium halimionae TaxID=1526413 RepID=A0A7W3PMR8_9MICO|nr:hypothetical protein [Microbacterium halimionae]MBA8817199.1 hypothetical protein [Microbacterium halimionae]NII94649.1 hypothetical protein [Microbacterium halimionae]